MIKNVLAPASPSIYKNLLNIAAPVALQNLIISSLSFVDTLMIGQLGETEIAAVGIGNQLFFLYMLLLYGVGSASGIFVSQYWGKKDYTSIRKTSGLSLSLGLLGALPFCLLSFIIPEQIVSVFSRDNQVITLGAGYLKMVALSYLFSSVTITMSQIQRSLERANLPLLVSLVSLALNTLLNYLFIFGKAGLPAWGVRGVGLATTIARAVECVLMLLIIYRSAENPAAGSLRELLGFDSAYLRKFTRTAAPVVLNELFWALGMTVFKVVYGRMGTSALASVNIAEAVMNLMFVALIGSATGTAVLTGKKIGEGNFSEARINGGKFSRFSVIEGVIIAVIGAALSGVLPQPFNVSAELKHNASLIILIFSFFLPFKSFNLHTIVGIFRGGGDTLYAALIEIAGVWGVGVVLAFVTGMFLGLPIHLVYAFVSIEELFKAVFNSIRLRSGKWVHDLT